MSQVLAGATDGRLSRQQTRERNRLALIASARRLIAAHGVDVSLEAITADAGLTTGAVYSNFGGKNQLMLAVAVEQIDEATADARRLEEIAGSLEEVLATHAEQIESWRSSPDARSESIFALHMVLLASQDEEFRGAVEAERAKELGALRAALTGRSSRHLPDGEVTTAEDARRLTIAFRALVDGYALRWTVSPTDSEDPPLIDAAVALGALLPALRARPAR